MGMTSLSLMGKIVRGGGRTRTKYAIGRNIQTAFAWFPSGTLKAFEILVPYYPNLFLQSALNILYNL